MAEVMPALTSQSSSQIFALIWREAAIVAAAAWRSSTLVGGFSPRTRQARSTSAPATSSHDWHGALAPSAPANQRRGLGADVLPNVPVVTLSGQPHRTEIADVPIHIIGVGRVSGMAIRVPGVLGGQQFINFSR